MSSNLIFLTNRSKQIFQGIAASSNLVPQHVDQLDQLISITGMLKNTYNITQIDLI